MNGMADGRILRALLPAISLTLVLAAIGWLNPRAISYMGFNLMLGLTVPIVLATIAQMFVIAGNDLDLAIGPFIGFNACVAATLLHDAPWVGAGVLASAIVAYAATGALIHIRQLPSIVVTLGMGFVWQGLALLVLPQPGGTAPDWVTLLVGIQPPLIPFSLLASGVIAIGAWFFLERTSYGVILRGLGGNADALARAGWSILKARVALYTAAGICGVLAGLTLVGQTTAADAAIGNGYTLLAIAGVILGGGEFTGGRVAPVGAVIGAITLSLAASSLLTFMHVPPDWQSAANGAILILVLGARLLAGRLVTV